MATLKNTSINDSGFFKLPAGTTAQEVTGVTNGALRFNTDVGKVQIFLNGSWTNVGI